LQNIAIDACGCIETEIAAGIKPIRHSSRVRCVNYATSNS
jgi:hypothetical protein